MRLKIFEWLKRYAPAEGVAILGALIGGGVMHYVFGNPIATALGGTWGENIGYYGQIIFTDLRRARRDGGLNFIGILKIARNVIVEFGPGEYLDSFVIRPAAMYFFLQTIESLPLALLLGKLSADVLFYVPVVLGYELRKKYLK